jgi:hypothetical protein
MKNLLKNNPKIKAKLKPAYAALVLRLFFSKTEKIHHIKPLQKIQYCYPE